MINKHFTKKTAKHQSGVVLVIGLIMLLALTLIGITSSSVTSLEEKMAANSKDKNLAFQAAEAALRAAEASLTASAKNFIPARTATATDQNQGADGLYSILNNDELADKAPTLKTTQPPSPYYSTVDWNATSTPKYIKYDNTTIKNLVGIYQEPRYILEELSSTPVEDAASSGGDLDTGGGITYSAQKQVKIRITARGWGSNGTAIATVQSVVDVIYE